MNNSSVNTKNKQAQSNCASESTADNRSLNDINTQRREAVDRAISLLSVEQIYNDARHNLKESNGEYRGLCFFHDPNGDGSKNSLSITSSNKMFRCTGCHAGKGTRSAGGGDPIVYRASIIAGRWLAPSEVTGKIWIDGAKSLCNDAGVDFPEKELSPQEKKQIEKSQRRHQILEAVYEFCQRSLWSDQGKQARRYLTDERGLTEQGIKDLQLGLYVSSKGLKQHLETQGFKWSEIKDVKVVASNWQDYITFPWRDERGKPLTMYARYSQKNHPDNKAKTLALAGNRSKRSPYFFDRVLGNRHRDIVVVEGILDGALAQEKGDSRVCAAVAFLNDGQLKALERNRIKSVNLVYDSDGGGTKNTSASIKNLNALGIEAFVTPLPSGYDPNDFILEHGIEAWYERLKQATHGFTWEAKRILSEGDLQTDKGKHDILNRCIEFASSIKANKENLDLFFWKQIKDELGMDNSNIEAQRSQLEKTYTETSTDGGYLDAQEVQERLDELIERDPAKSEVERKLGELINSTVDLDAYSIRNIYHSKKDEKDKKDSLEDVKNTQLPTILKARNQRLNLADYLWGDGGSLAEKITSTADAMPAPPEYIFTTLIATAGSRIDENSKVVIKPKAKYSRPCHIFRTMVVGKTGDKKTPAQRIAIDPLEQFEAEANEKFEDDCEAYERDLRDWKNSEQSEDPPKRPTRKRYILSDATIEAKVAIHQGNPRGFLIYLDEASAHLNSRNKYRNGSGDDREAELSEFNGKAISKDRADDKNRIFIPQSSVSRTGSIQFETLADLMGSHADATGEWARWLVCAAPCPKPYLDITDDEDTGVDKALYSLYEAIEKVKKTDFLLSPDAKEIFQAKQQQLVDAMSDEDDAGLRSAYPKFEDYLGRLAGWLHIVNASLAGEEPEPSIPGSTMRKASELISYFIGQLRLVYALNSPEQELSGIALKLHEYAERKGTAIPPYKFKTGVRNVKNAPTQEVKNHLQSLVDAGYGYWDGSKYKAGSHNPQSPSDYDRTKTNYDKTKTKRQHPQVESERGLQDMDYDRTKTVCQHSQPPTQRGIESETMTNFDNHLPTSPPNNPPEAVEKESDDHQGVVRESLCLSLEDSEAEKETHTNFECVDTLSKFSHSQNAGPQTQSEPECVDKNCLSLSESVLGNEDKFTGELFSEGDTVLDTHPSADKHGDYVMTVTGLKPSTEIDEGYFLICRDKSGKENQFRPSRLKKLSSN